MPNRVAELLPRLEAQRLPDLETGNGILLPDYSATTLANLPATICRWLGADPLGCPPLAPQWRQLTASEQYQHVILLVVDGLGLKLFKRFWNSDPWVDWIQAGALAPLTSVVPSTTAAALTSLWTGCTPAEHGIIGFDLWLKEFGMVGNMIFHSPSAFGGETGSLRRAGFQPETFLPVTTLGAHLHRQDIKVFSFQHNTIARSGLSTMLLPDVETLGYRTLSDLWVTLASVQESLAGERSYTYVYYGDLDELSHRYGPDDERVLLEFSAFTHLLERFMLKLAKKRRGDTLFLMVADHGQIQTPHFSKYELRNHPELLRHFAIQPTGEARLPYLFVRPGREQAVRDYLQQVWAGQFEMLPGELVLQSGLLGREPVYARTYDRLGDWVVLPQGNAYWWFPERENPLLGRHGGLSQAEMVVPLLMLTV
ncbi:MAG TPA: alkaline phosphatase family protein [Longilinea sp.]|nr:alkaline phosphatase family protein [Longilinea sp.]